MFVGLTGGTGSGKSTLARVWAELGAVVIDADQLARQVVAPGEVLEQIRARFGEQVIAPDGQLDRAGLAAIVFADAEALRDLEAITHPAIERRTAELRDGAPAGAVVVHDMPLIVEKGTAQHYDLVVVVDAPVEDRVRRLIGRGLAEDDARRRIAAQATTEQRRAVADVWVDNSGSRDELELLARRLWTEVLQPA